MQNVIAEIRSMLYSISRMPKINQKLNMEV